MALILLPRRETTENGWLEPVQLPRSQGRQDQRVALAAGPNGRLHGAWPDGNRFAELNAEGTDYLLLPDVPPGANTTPALESIRRILSQSPDP